MIIQGERRAAVGLGVGLLFASANGLAGGYVGLGTGIVYAPDERFEETSVFLDYDLGFRVAALTLGYGFQNGLRTELEVSYRSNDLEIIEFTDARGLVNLEKTDAVDATTMMANLIYDFDMGVAMRPYVGIGAGATRLGYEFSKKDTVLDPGEGILDETNTAFAYQVIVGVAAPLGRRFHFNADYRYWRALEVDMTTDAGDPISTEHEMQVVSLGLRYDFTPREVEKYRPAPISSGGYTEVQLGWLQAEDSDIDDGLIDTNFDAFAVGAGGSVTAGYAWGFQSGRRVRAELGLTYWTNDADIIEFGPLLGEFRLRGSVDTLALSGNLLYEPAASGVLRPYVGIGAGYAEVDYNVTLLDSGGESQYVDDSDSGFATQVLLGVSTRLSSRFEASLNYRYWWIPAIELKNPAGGTLKTEHSAHGLMLGLRYLFQ